MTGILNVLLGSASQAINSFNITAAVMGGGAGYSDGSAGTSTGVATGSITGGTLSGGKIIAEVSTFSGLTQDRFRARGFSSDPGQSWLRSITVNSATHTGASATYTWDATHSTASWVWTPVTWNLTSPNTYNSNSITHSL